MKKRFTLVEVLAVVFLIGVLTAIGFGMYSYAMNSAREKATRSLFARLGAAIESCNTKFGYIPPSTTTKEFNALLVTVTDGEITKLEFGGRTFSSTATQQSEKDYLKEFLRIADAETLKKSINSDKELEDSWGGVIYYAYPGKFNKTSYDLYSAGADGRIGTKNEEISSAKANAVKLTASGSDNYLKDSSDNSMACDDIVNF